MALAINSSFSRFYCFPCLYLSGVRRINDYFPANWWILCIAAGPGVGGSGQGRFIGLFVLIEFSIEYGGESKPR